MRIGIIMVRYETERISPIFPEMIRLLREWGVTVDIIYPEQYINDISRLNPDYDIYLLKSKSHFALSIAGALYAQGAVFINPYPVTLNLRDKIITTRILQQATINTPQTFIANTIDQLIPMVNQFPLVIKPYQGSQGKDVYIVSTETELLNLQTTIHQGIIFAQQYLPPDGHDHKIYAIGNHLFGVRRVWPPTTYEEKLGTPFTLTPEMRDIALACGKAFNIELFGIDIVVSNGHPYVVDMSSFPGFKGVPNAALRLADYIYHAAQTKLQGTNPSQTVASSHNHSYEHPVPSYGVVAE